MVGKRLRIRMFQISSLFAVPALAAAAFFSFVTTVTLSSPAHAVPTLQVYIEGATYDSEDETWVIANPAFSPLRLWAIGNVDGPGGKGDIFDVRAVFAYSSGAGNVSFNIVPSVTGDAGGFTDPSVPSSPTLVQTRTDGSQPVMADGRKLSKHGVYGNGTDWQEWALGDFTDTDSPIADFIDSFPDAPLDPAGQINVYDIFVSGLPLGEPVHIDLFGYYYASNGRLKGTFAPFSHDGEFTQIAFTPNPVEDQIPAPGAALLMGATVAWVAVRRRHHRSR